MNVNQSQLFKDIALKHRPTETIVNYKSCPDQHVGTIRKLENGTFDDNVDALKKYVDRISLSQSFNPRSKRCVILILESPHMDEYKGNPGPAKGTTGTNIKKHLGEVLLPIKDKFSDEQYDVLIMNAICFQTSLGISPLSKVIRNNVFINCWNSFGRENFQMRLKMFSDRYKGGVVGNFCTQIESVGVKPKILVKNEISLIIKNILSSNFYSVEGYHPSRVSNFKKKLKYLNIYERKWEQDAFRK